ncbi:MAG: hypothetical protein WBM50_04965 [Acidimicrobiales bacterium]
MNRLLLDQLQRMRSYPSVTVLLNTNPGTSLSVEEQAGAARLIATADQRLSDRVDDGQRLELVDRLKSLVAERGAQRNGHALALCVSPEHRSVISLGGAVEERVVIDETFATRDLVADLHRTAAYRVVAVSESMVREFLGDRVRIVEERSEEWPLRREEGTSITVWSKMVAEALSELDAEYSLPIVVAGVKRTATRLVDDTALNVIGVIAGNHDRTNPSDLHTMAWPLVVDWLATRQDRALERLDRARSAKQFASGVDEIWSLAGEGRIDLVVVEDGFSLSARIDEQGHVHPTDDEGREVTDDVVDEILEAVLRHDGEVAIVDNGALVGHGRIAAVVRF